MALRRSAEDYLEAIYVLASQKGAVRSVDVAHHLDYSKPSISRAVNKLKDDGYLDIHADGELILTDKGRQIAKNIYERHTILTSFFTAIGVSPKTAAEDACKVEHAISAETFDCLKKIYKKNPPAR